MGDFGTFSWTFLRDRMLDSLEEGVCVFDRQFQIIVANAALPRLLNMPDAAFNSGCSLLDVLHGCAERGDFETRPENLADLLSTDQPVSATIDIQGDTPSTMRIKPLTRDLTLALFSQKPSLQDGSQASGDPKYREFLDQTTTPVMIHRDEVVIFVNRALTEQVGLPTEMFVGRRLTDFVPDGRLERYHERMNSGEIGPWEVQVKLPNGAHRWCETAMAQVEWDGESAWQMTFDDTTERRQAEQTLKRQAIVMQQVSEGVLISDLVGNIIDCNESACRIYQIPREEFIGSSVVKLITEEADPADYLRRVHHEVETTGSFYQKTTYTRPDGSKRYVDVSVSTWMGPDDKPMGRIAGVRDATGRRRAEQAVAQSEARFRNLIESSIQGVLIHRNGTIVYVNPATAGLFGVSAEAMIGRIVTDFIAPPTADLQHAFLNGDVSEPIKVRSTRDDNTTIWVEVNARVVDWDGEPARQVMINDITERQQAEEALQHAQKLESLGQLTGGIAHDFNNLLGVISGNLELLRELLGDNEDQATFIEASLRSVRRGAELTQRLLAFSRKTPLKPQETDINTLIQSMSGMLQRTLGEIIMVETKLDSPAWSVSVDPGQMENALLNLALNARDAMPRGGQLQLQTRNVSLHESLIRQNSVVPAGDYLQVCVSDTGTGMPAEVLENAFQPFYTTKEVGAGSGLGLSMVYGFVQQSSGHIYIDSTPGRGTSINMFLPKSETQPMQDDFREPGAAAPTGNKEVVMVVEDDEDLRQLSVILLNRMGYQTHEAADGPSAMKLLADLRHIDLLFTDLVLPGGLGGFEIAKAAKSAFPSIKVLFTSGYSESETFREAFEGGQAELIPKPYRKDALAERLQAVLQS